MQYLLVRPGCYILYSSILFTFILEEQDSLHNHRMLTALLVDKYNYRRLQLLKDLVTVTQENQTV